MSRTPSRRERCSSAAHLEHAPASRAWRRTSPVWVHDRRRSHGPQRAHRPAARRIGLRHRRGARSTNGTPLKAAGTARDNGLEPRPPPELSTSTMCQTRRTGPGTPSFREAPPPTAPPTTLGTSGIRSTSSIRPTTVQESRPSSPSPTAAGTTSTPGCGCALSSEPPGRRGAVSTGTPPAPTTAGSKTLSGLSTPRSSPITTGA